MAKGVKRTIGIYINGKEVSNDIKSINAAVAQATASLNKMTVGSKEYYDQAAKIKQLNTILASHRQELKGATSSLSNWKKNILSIGAGIGGWMQSLQALNGFTGTLCNTTSWLYQ